MSIVAIALPLLAATGFGLAGPWLADRLPPRQATWLVSLGALICASACLAVLAMLGFVLVAQMPALAAEGHWSKAILREHAGVEPGLGLVSLIAALASCAAMAAVAWRRGRALAAAYRTCGAMPRGGGNLVVVEDPSAGALAIPGRPGRIVVARSLLGMLPALEARALIAHERAHLEHGHHWHRSLVSLAAAANPLLAPLRAAVRDTTERWADEVAAEEVADRSVAARALARAALLTNRPALKGELALAATASAVATRVTALLGPPPRSRPALILPAVALLVAVLAGLVMAEAQTEQLFEFAGHAYRTTHGG